MFPFNDPSFNKDWDEICHWFGDKRHFRPWYDDDADYNTNAKSYYDFLARFIRQLDYMITLMNKLLDENIETLETNTVRMQRDGDWKKYHIENGQIVYDTGGSNIEKLSAYVKISKASLNDIVAKDDGIWSENFQPKIDALNKRIDDLDAKVERYHTELLNLINALTQRVSSLETRVTNLETRVTNLENALKKLLTNLTNTGAWSYTGSIFGGNLNSGHNLATGNINLFGGTTDGNSFIRCNNGHTENDITAGI